MEDLHQALGMLAGQSGPALAAMFWYTLVFEVPRYGFPLLGVVLGAVAARDGQGASRASAISSGPARVSVVVVGHNEADVLERCVRSLREQSFAGFEIVVVSDGSNDGMAGVAGRLVRAGLADVALGTDLRGGKSSALNLAIGASSGDIIVTVDCDCSYDRFALEEILRPFADPRIGAVCGDVVPRNGDAGLLSRFQEIEYLFAISVGKRIGAQFGQVVCMSGAFSAFRREALEAIGGFDVGGGEDLDVTLRLRARGWAIGFAPAALCHTDVPEAFWPLVRQRLRWERDSVRLRYRKMRDLMLPGGARFAAVEALHQWDFLLFGVLGAVTFPVYVVWLFAMFGAFAPVILIAAQLGLLVLDAAALALAAGVAGRPAFWRNLAYTPGFAVFNGYVMRSVRLCAYVGEWMLFASTRDNYVPARVRQVRKW